MDYSDFEKLSVPLEPCLPLYVVYRDQEEEEGAQEDLAEPEDQDPDCVSHASPQTTRDGSLVCSFCGLPQPSQHLLNEHHLDHIEEDCKYCPYCCFTCLAPRTLKKHLREHAAHNQMCHRHCHYIDMHDPNGDFYIDGEESCESSFEEASDNAECAKKEGAVLTDEKGLFGQAGGNADLPVKSGLLAALTSPQKSASTLFPASASTLFPASASTVFSASLSPLLGLPQLPVDAASLHQVSELLKSSMLANGMSKNGLNTSNILEKLLLSQLQSSMAMNSRKPDVGSRAAARKAAGKSAVPPPASEDTPNSSNMDYSDFLENTHDSIAEKIHSFFQPDDGSVDGELSEDGDVSYSCPSCRFTCSHRSLLTRHLTTHSESFKVKGKLYLRCPQCPFCSSSKSNLHRHIATHSRKLGCPSTETGNLNWDIVAKGSRSEVPRDGSEADAPPQPSLPTILNGKTLLFCTVCDYTSYYKSNLNRHMARHGSGDPAAADSSFNDSNSPESSPNSPSPPPPEPEPPLPPPAQEGLPKQVLTCKSCVYTTHNLANFRKHSLIHSQSKNLWHCCMCTYSSFEKSNVKRHIRMKHRQSGEGVADLDIFCYMKKDKKFHNGKVRSENPQPDEDGDGKECASDRLMSNSEVSSFPYWAADGKTLAATWNEFNVNQEISRALMNQLQVQRAIIAAQGCESFIGDSEHHSDEEMAAITEGDSSMLNPRGDSSVLNLGGESSVLNPEGDTSMLNPEGDSSMLNPEGDPSMLNPEGDSSMLNSGVNCTDERESSLKKGQLLSCAMEGRRKHSGQDNQSKLASDEDVPQLPQDGVTESMEEMESSDPNSHEILDHRNTVCNTNLHPPLDPSRRMSNEGMTMSGEGTKMFDEGTRTSNEGRRKSHEGTRISGEDPRILDEGTTSSMFPSLSNTNLLPLPGTPNRRITEEPDDLHAMDMDDTDTHPASSRTPDAEERMDECDNHPRDSALDRSLESAGLEFPAGDDDDGGGSPAVGGLLVPAGAQSGVVV